VRQVIEKGKGRLQPRSHRVIPPRMANLLILLMFFNSPPISVAADQFYTFQIDHWENRKNPTFDRKSFEGRHWDIKGLLAYSSNLATIHQLNSPNGSSYLGHSYCVRVVDSFEGQNSFSASGRAILLKNFLGRLRMRQAEMNRAGAYFRIQYPSNCAERGLSLKGKRHNLFP
jgi:hypothetical protein